MVDRRADADPVLIVDLDGTLLSVNSYPRWARRLAHGRFPHLSRPRRLAVATRSSAVLLARKAGLIGHDRAKGQLQLLWQAATHDDGGASAASLSEELLTFVRPDFTPLLAAVRCGAVDAVLATAAAAEYACALGRVLGFAHVLAGSRAAGDAAAGSSGERKLNAVTAWLAAQGWADRPLVLFTDHPDDLLLMRLCPTVYWFGSTAHRRLCQRLMPANLFYEATDPRFAAALSALLAHCDAPAARSRRICR